MAGAGGDLGNSGDLIAVLGGDVAGVKLQCFDESGVDGVGECAAELVGDRHAVDDVSELIMSAARMDRAISIGSKARESGKDLLDAAAGAGTRELVDGFARDECA